MMRRHVGCTIAALLVLFVAVASQAAPPAVSYLPAVRSALPQSLPTPTATDVPLQSFATAFGTRSWASGDIDGDGLDDIVVAPTYGRYRPLLPLQIWINLGDGRFADRTSELIEGPVPVVDSAQVFLIADFNGDGRADVMIVQSGLEDTLFNGGTVLALLSQPNGKLVDRSAVAIADNVASHIQSAVMADLNGDGALDIVISHPCQQDFEGCGVLLLINDGGGHFTSTATGLPAEIAYYTFPLPPEPWCCPNRPFQNPNAVGAGDIDGDGRVDLITGTGAGGDDFDNVARVRTIRVHQQEANGAFVERARLPIPDAMKSVGGVGGDNPPTDLVALEIKAVDLNGDGRPDIVVLWEGTVNQMAASHIVIHRNDGNFQFTDVTLEWFGTYVSGRGTRNVGTQRLVDVNGDGVPDLVFGTPASAHPPADFIARSFMFLNDGTGHFTPWTLRLNGQIPTAASLAGLLGCDPPGGPSGVCVEAYMPLALDANGDGVPDVVLVNHRGTTASPVREATVFLHTFLAVELPTVAFAQAAYSVGEGNSSVTLTVNRAGDPSVPVTVRYVTSDETAVAAQDYTGAARTLTFAAGVTSRTIVVPITNDTLAETNETFLVTLDTPGPGVGLGALTTARVTIVDNDAAGSVRFIAPAFTSPEAGNAMLTLQRSGGSAGGVVVGFRTVDGTARAGVDYTARTGSVTFAAGQLTQAILVPIVPNRLVDGDRTFTVELTSIAPSSGALVSPSSAAVTIRSEDVGGVVRFAVPTAAALEGLPAVLMLTRTGGTGGNVSVQWATADMTAKAGTDYTATSGVVTFGANETLKTISIPTLADAAVEGDETFRVTLHSPVGLALGTPVVATVTVQDGQQGLQFGAAEYTVGEGTANALITVVRTGPATEAVTAQYSTSPGSATPGADYTAVNGTVTVAANARTATFVVPIVNDALAEGPETVLLTLSDPSAPAQLGSQRTAVLTILDNDVAGVIRLGAATSTVAEGARTATITVLRTGNAGGVTVDYATTPGTAAAGEDYFTAVGTLTFGPGETTRTFAVTILSDTRDEPDETFTVTLSNPGAGATLGTPASMVVTITDDDRPGTIAFSAATSTASETAGAAFLTVTRTGGMAGGVTVHYATANGSAEASRDYTARSGTLTFSAGETRKTLAVPILADTEREGHETFSVTLSDPGGGAALGTLRSALVTIQDDETGPTVQFSAAAFSVPESAGTASVVVTRTGAVAAGQTVVVRTTPGGTAPPGDFIAVDQTITFAAGQTLVTVPVTILGNLLIDGDRTVGLELVNPSDPLALGAPRRAMLTIRDDDAQLRFGSAGILVVEGGVATLTVQRIGATLGTASVKYATVNGTAIAPGDYTAKSGTVRFGPGVASQTITVTTLNDRVAETDEVFTVTLSQPVGATLGSPSTATVGIQDNDAVGTVQFSAATYAVVEGSLATITVTRSAGAAGPITVGFATVPGGSATGGSKPGPGIDYVTRSGTLTFAAGIASQTFTVPTGPDTLAEGARTVNLALSIPPGSAAVLGATPTATLTIVDDEQPRFQFSAATTTVGEAAGAATLTVQRLGPSTGHHSVSYVLTGVTAAAGADFDPAGGTLTFPPGIVSRTITVPVVADTLNEVAETFTATLTSPSLGASLGTPSVATVTITDDDPAGTVQFSAANYSVAEGGSVTLLVTRTGAAGPVTVAYSVVNGTANGGVLFSDLVTFAAGEISKPVVFRTLLDTALEGSEFFDVVLGVTSGGLVTGTPSRARVWILDEQQSLQFGAATSSVVEGGTATISVTRTGIPVGIASATVTLGGTAVAGTDYTDPGPIVLTFASGIVTQTFAIQTLPDTLVEAGGRTLTLALNGVTGAVAGTPAAATVTIVDNDRPDLIVGAVTGPAQAGSGMPLAVTATVRNQAAAPALASKLGVFLSADATPGSGARIGLVDVPALAPLASATVTGAAPIPGTMPAGTYFLSVLADATSVVTEAVESNNGLTAAAQVEIVPFLPDLVVTTVLPSASTLTGKVVSAPVRVHNAGPVASGPFRVGVFLSPDPAPGTGTLLAIRDMPGLAAGTGADVPLGLVVPEDMAQGDYYVSGVVDLNGTVLEADETNNALASPVAFAVRRNLTKFTRVSASFSTAFLGCDPRLAGQTLNLTGTLALASQTGTTGQGMITLTGNVAGAPVTFRGTFSATVELDDSVTIRFTVSASGAFTGTATATGSGSILNGVLQANVSGLLTVADLGACPFTGTLEARGDVALFFSLLHFAEGGAFGGFTTPNPTYPLPITGVSAALTVLFDPAPPLDPFLVRFTGPPGSGIVNAPGDLRLDFPAGSFYETDTLSVAGRTLSGAWSVRYRNVNRAFTVPNPEAEQRFVAMLPTVILDTVQTHIVGVSWVFKDRRTGATVPAPAHADALQVELYGTDVDFASRDFPRTVTSLTLPTPIPVADVEVLYISYKDSLTGNFYVTKYTP